MKYCQYCGEELPDDASFCTNCGRPTSKAYESITNTQAPAKESSVIPVLALVFGALGGLLGLIFSLIGLVKCREKNHRIMCIIGLCLFVIWAIIGFTSFIEFLKLAA